MPTTNPRWEFRIRDAVDRALLQKGWQRSDSNADVVITAVGSAQNQQEYQTFDDGMGGWGPEVATTTVTNYRVVIDMYEAQNKQLIFRGSASDTLSKNAKHNEKDLDKAVDKMFKKFSPEANGHER